MLHCDFYLRNPFLYQAALLKINGVGLQHDSLHRNSPRSVTLPVLFASITHTMIFSTAQTELEINQILEAYGQNIIVLNFKFSSQVICHTVLFWLFFQSYFATAWSQPVYQYTQITFGTKQNIPLNYPFRK